MPNPESPPPAGPVVARSPALKVVGGIVLAVIVIGVGVLVWYATRPGPLAFAGGNRVPLAQYDGHPSGAPADLQNASLIERGRYLTDAADCQACHTAEGGKPFAGGRPFKLPYFGTLYAPNITPDTETGIGRWSDAEFLRALHQGIGRDGKRLYPAFPYAAYTYLTDADGLAIKAYLFSLAPVRSATPENAMNFPFNQRWLMVFWSTLFNPDKRFEPVPARGPEWNRGAYLAEALEHCGECHTPRNLIQGLNNSQKYAGAVAQGWLAYNITGDRRAGIGDWSSDDLAQFLSIGHAHGHGTAAGPMGEAVDLSLSRLTPSDVRALVTYVQSVTPIDNSGGLTARTEPASAKPSEGVSAQADPKGKAIFAGACAGCHGWTGVSPVGDPATLIGTRGVNDPHATNVAQIILTGSSHPRSNGVLLMPNFAVYSDSEIAAVANYVTARFGRQGSSLSAEDVRKMREAL